MSKALMHALLSLSLLSTLTLPALAVSPPENMETLHVPEIPERVQQRVDQYRNVRSAGFVSWLPKNEGLMVTTRFGETYQLHQVQQPGGRREQVSFFKEPLSNAYFSPTQSRSFLFTKDVGGSESYQLFAFDRESGRERMLSDGKSRNGRPVWNHAGSHFVYANTRRNQKDYDVYLYDYKTDAETRVFEGEGYWAPSHWSPDDQQLLLFNYISANASQYLILDLATQTTRPLFPELNGKASFGAAFFSADGQGVYYSSDQGSEFKQLYYRDLKSGRMSALAPELKWDIQELELSPDGRHLALIVNEDGLGKLYVMNTQTRKWVTLPDLPVGQVSSAYFSPDSQQLAFTLSTSRSPADVYSFPLGAKALTRWTYSEVGGLQTQNFPEARLVRYPSFDRRMIPAYYFHPPQAKSPKAAPVIIYIHGGPEGQYRPRFNSLFQYWLNELGIAVIAPNVRGSRGYGKAYLKLDNGYKREDSVKDIGALLDWIKTQPQLDSERVAVYGGSYGGYMVLASLIHYGDRLKAGVESVGISNFVTFLENTKAYRRDLRRVEYGDERDPQMRAFLQRISPTTNASKIKSPLMVVQGLNDPRVPASEAEQIVKAVEAQDKPVWYLLARDEGHGFRKKPNQDFYYYTMSLFWEKFLLP